MSKKILFIEFLVFTFYLLFLLNIAFFVRDTPNQSDAYNTTLQKISETGLGYGDLKSFATAAQDIARNGWISDSNSWIFSLWPPLFIMLEALIVKVGGQGVPIILIVQIMSSIFLALFMMFFCQILRQYARLSISLLLPLLPFLLPMPRAFLLQPYGVVWGESFAISCFLIGLALSVRSVQRRAFDQAVYAGIFIGLSAYFRSQFAIFALALTCSGFLFAALIYIFYLRSDKSSSASSLNFRYFIKNIAIIILAIQLTMMPWRVYRLIEHHNLSWISTSDVTFGNSVHSTEYLQSVGAGFVVEGGGNLVCRIDPATCENSKNAKYLFIKTFLSHPIQWYHLKFELIGKYWFSSIENIVSVYQSPNITDIIANAICMMALIIIAALSFTPLMMRNQVSYVTAWINFSILLSHILIFTVQQFEIRYFYFIKIYALIMMMIKVVTFFYLKNSNKELEGNPIKNN